MLLLNSLSSKSYAVNKSIVPIYSGGEGEGEGAFNQYIQDNVIIISNLAPNTAEILAFHVCPQPLLKKILDLPLIHVFDKFMDIHVHAHYQEMI
jgi:hypothetical protein